MVQTFEMMMMMIILITVIEFIVFNSVTSYEALVFSKYVDISVLFIV